MIAGAAAGAVARTLMRRHGLVVRRPVHAGGARTFPLAAVRTRPRGAVRGRPVLVVPGGPGLGSVVPYAGFRAAAARRGLDVLMVEHRGVGLSRRDDDGVDLPPGAVTVEGAADDLAAVLDAAGVPEAVVYGSSYGTYLAQVLAARHPHRVAALVLDSPLLAVEDDLATVRAYRRALLWDGDEPALAPVAEEVRAVAAAGVPMPELGDVVRVVYEFAGPGVLLRLLRARRRGRLRHVWARIGGLDADQVRTGLRYLMEPDLVAEIAYGELGFGLPPDGGPLDPRVHAGTAVPHPRYRGEPYDLPARLPAFGRPVVVVSGDRDLRTPRPVAERVVELAADAVLVPLPRTGHSALDSHQLAALEVASRVAAGGGRDLPGQAERLAAFPRRGPAHWLGPMLTTLVAAGSAGRRPRFPRA